MVSMIYFPTDFLSIMTLNVNDTGEFFRKFNPNMRIYKPKMYYYILV